MPTLTIVFEEHRRRAILVVEDNHDFALLIQVTLERASAGEFETTHVDSLAAARAHLRTASADCVLLDLSLADARDLEGLADIRAEAPHLPVVILSGHEDETLAMEAVRSGAQDYLIKGQADGHVLKRVIRYAINRKDAEAQLAERAMRDDLTGLPTRALFKDRLAHALARVNRYGNLVAVLFLDLDGFKPINDEFGHAVGDEVLKEVAARLRGVLRASDTSARYGGDEFTILCEQITGHEDAIASAERVLDAMSDPFELQGRLLHVGVSIGIALGGVGYQDPPESLVRDADAAMYEAKRTGNRYAVFELQPPLESPSAS